MSQRARRPRRAAAGPEIRRKNENIDQTRLERVRRLLHVETETEAIDQALALVLLREDLVRGVQKIAGTGGVANVFDGDREP